MSTSGLPAKTPLASLRAHARPSADVQAAPSDPTLPTATYPGPPGTTLERVASASDGSAAAGVHVVPSADDHAAALRPAGVVTLPTMTKPLAPCAIALSRAPCMVAMSGTAVHCSPSGVVKTRPSNVAFDTSTISSAIPITTVLVAANPVGTIDSVPATLAGPAQVVPFEVVHDWKPKHSPEHGIPSARMPSPAADPTAIAASLNGVAGEAAVQLVPSADVHSPPSCFPSTIAAEPTVTKPLPKTATSFRALPAKVSPDRAVQVPPPVSPEAAPPAPQPV